MAARAGRRARRAAPCRAPRAARGRGTGGRRPRRRAAPWVSLAVRACALGRLVVLGGEEHLGRLLGHLAAGEVHAALEQRDRVRARRAGPRPGRRSSPTATRASAKPCGSAARARRHGPGRPRSRRVEAGARLAVAGGAGGLDAEQQRVAVAVERQRPEAEDVARTSRPCATGGRATASGSAPRRCRASPRAPRRPASRPSARGRRRRPGPRRRRGPSASQRDGGRVQAGGEVDRARARRGVMRPPPGRWRAPGSPAAAIAALTSRDRELAPVEDAGGEDGVGAAVADRRHEVGRARGAARGDDRDPARAR